MQQHDHSHEPQSHEFGSLPFRAIQQDQVPKGREGKHKRTVTLVLNRLHRLKPGSALKIPLSALPGSKANIRAALNRATRQQGLHVATSSDSTHLYIWKVQHRS